MEPNTRLRSAVRGFYLWIGSIVLVGLAPILAMDLIEQETTAARVGGVLLGVGGMLPWMWIVYSIIRRGDEFARQMHLVALGFAFAGTIVLMAALEWLVEAEFIDPPSFKVVVLGSMVLWLISLLGARSYFERQG
jgi:hypothetical protein